MANGMGRPVLYKYWCRKANLEKLQKWAEKGLNRVEIAANMNIAVSTLWRWMHDVEEIKDAIQRGDVIADEQVINELHRNAVGYFYPEEVAIKVRSVSYRKGKRYEKEEVVTKVIQKWHPAETLAQVFWVKNRRAEEWRDKQIVEQSVMQIPVEIVNDSPAVEE